jgi:hypothetical protein
MENQGPHAIPRLPRKDGDEASSTMEKVREVLRGLSHGEVTVVVQDGVVVQLKRTDRHRLARANPNNSIDNE